jgi:hypothetical protein
MGSTGLMTKGSASSSSANKLSASMSLGLKFVAVSGGALGLAQV